MNPEFHQRAGEIFFAAIEIEISQRAAFLDNACAGDQALRREVESLIASHERAQSFLESGAMKAAARAIAANQPNISPGEEIGRYRVISLLGVGGMGEVYLAEDARLGRKIAIKILPAQFTADAVRLRRFEQEAKAASALNHPNIITIHEIGEARGLRFIATEFIDGQTLRERLLKEKLPLKAALDIARQVAEALVAAHEAGIIHRDIKPENIMLRRDGYVKVLDFGLAKLTERQSDGATGRRGEEYPTLVLSPDRPVAPSPRHPVRTDPGALMGTANYMSPEQARGLDVDHRSDLFSLGIVLYEMLAGKTPFAGESPTAVRAAIFAQEPPPLAPAETPKELQRIVNRALCKDPERRYQSARELLDDLKRLQRETERQTNLDRSLALALAAVIISILAGSIGVWSFFKSRRQPPPQNGQISATRLTAAGAVNDVAVSPDGRYVAYTIGHYADRSLWAREMATGGEAQLLPAGAGYVYQSLAFTPVGDEIYYVAYERAGDVNALYRIPARGGTPRRVLERIDSPAAFAPDGQRFAFVRYDREFGQSEIVITNTDGGGERTLIARRDPVKLSTRRIAWSHDGRSIAYAAGTHSNERDHYVYEALVADGTERLLSPQPWRAIKGVAWLGGRGGLALLATDPVNDMFLIWGLSLPGGERRKLSTELGDPSDLSVTADGETIITAHAEEKQSVWVAPSAGLSRIRQLTPALEEAGRAGLTWTYDGRILYVTRSGGRPSIRVMDADGGNDRQFSSGNDDAPSVTPDGRHIVFCSTTDGPHIWRMDGDGSNRRRLTFGKREVEPRCTPDGRWVVYVSLEGNQRILWRAPIDGGVPIQLTDVTTATPHPAVSPDGKWLAYYHRDPRETERKRILIIPTSGGPPVKTLDVPHTAYLLQWSPGGRAIDYADAREGSTELWRTPLDGGRPRRLTSFELHSVSRFAWSRDGSRLVVSLVTHSRDVVLIRDF